MEYNILLGKNKIFAIAVAFVFVTISITLLQPHGLLPIVQAQSVTNGTLNSTQNQSADKIDCSSIGKTLGGIPVPNGKVCDIVIVREFPQVKGQDGLVMNEFTLMNSVIEFRSANITSSSTPSNHSVHVMGDFALLETEMNPVLQTITKSGWTVTGIHNHMILESPKMTFVHWTAQGDLNTVIEQVKEALSKTTIQGAK
jgi:hypothetical protein